MSDEHHNEHHEHHDGEQPTGETVQEESYDDGDMGQNAVNFSIDDGKVFYSDEVSITNNPLKFIFDFKNSTPRIDVRSQEAVPIVVEHNVVVMDIYLAKVLSQLLDDHIKKYEEQFGEVHKPQVLEQVEHELKDHEKHPITTTKEDHPNYFG